MDPVTIVVLLIGFGVWVLSNVMRNAAPNQPAGKPGPRPRAAGSDIDRFLEEINRRRQQQQQQQPLQRQPPPAAAPERPAAALPRRPMPARPIEAKPLEARPRPKPKPVRVEQALPRAKAVVGTETQTKAEPVLRPQAIVVGTPVVPPPSARVVDVAPMAAGLTAQESAAAQPAGSAEAMASLRGPSSLALEIRRLLREPPSLRAAMVATEILGPPRCRRRFRR